MTAEIAVAIGTMPGVDATSARQRELPVFDPVEVERAVGFVRLVRLLVAVPMTTIGLLAFGAGVAIGHPLFALVSGAITGLILVSLWNDTRLTKSVELLRRGDLGGAASGLRRVVRSSHRTAPQRWRAAGFLATIAWRRGDREAALDWIRTRRRALARSRGATADERWRTAATEVWLLALLGFGDEAHAGLDDLGPAPPGDDDACMVEITARLVVAFVRGEADDVRPKLREWTAWCERHDHTGLASAALAWAFDATGDRDAAWTWAERARCTGDIEHLRTHAASLHRWLATYGRGQPYGR